MTKKSKNSPIFLFTGTIALCVLSFFVTDVSTVSIDEAARVRCTDVDHQSLSTRETLGVALNGPCSKTEENSEDRLNFAVMSGVYSHWMDSCPAESLDWCSQALRARHIQLQYDLLERIQSPIERAQALQLACTTPENAEAVRHLMGADESVDTLILEGCFMRKDDFERQLVAALDKEELRTTALLLAAAYQVALPQKALSDKDALLSQWLMSSKR